MTTSSYLFKLTFGGGISTFNYLEAICSRNFFFRSSDLRYYSVLLKGEVVGGVRVVSALTVDSTFVEASSVFI